MDCTLRDKTLDLRDTPSRHNKEGLMEDKDPKVIARREVLREIFRLAAEVERCENGELSMPVHFSQSQLSANTTEL